MATQPETCNICCETFNRSVRIKICCPFCSFEACRSCCETFLLNEQRAVCMQPKCDKEWSRKFLREHFTDVFLMKRYRPHLERIMYEQEKALLPATQPQVVARMEERKYTAMMREVEVQIQALKQRREQLYNEMVTRMREMRAERATTKEEAERKKFVRQCPNNDCRGFLSTQWKCGLCNLWACPNCHEVKGPEKDSAHTCDPNNVETARLLDKDSKPCPNCQSLIFRISGCDQMFCTVCSTAFNWRSGKVQTGPIHNPHYFEWQRQQAALAGAAGGHIEGGRRQETAVVWQTDACGGANVVTHAMLNAFITLVNRHSNLRRKAAPEESTLKLSTNYRLNNAYRVQRVLEHYIPEVQRVADIMRHVMHNDDVVRGQFQVPTNPRTANEELRVRFLMGDISEEEFMVSVQRADKRIRKNMEVRQVLDVCNTTVRDICARVLQDLETSAPNEHHFTQLLSEFDGLLNFCNSILADIAFTYNCTVMYRFTHDFQWRSGAPTKNKLSLREKQMAESDSSDAISVASTSTAASTTAAVPPKKPRKPRAAPVAPAALPQDPALVETAALPYNGKAVEEPTAIAEEAPTPMGPQQKRVKKGPSKEG